MQYPSAGYGSNVVLHTDGSVLILSTVDNMNCDAKRFPPGSAQTTWSRSVSWQGPCNSLVLTDSGLAIALGASAVFALDAETGAVAWSQSFPGAQTTGLSLSSGKVVVSV